MQALAQTTNRTLANRPFPAEERILMQLGQCLDQGCFVWIEHAAAIAPRFSAWRLWEQPSCYNGNLDAVYDSIESCRRAHADHHIRLNVENVGWHSKLSVTVHRPH